MATNTNIKLPKSLPIIIFVVVALLIFISKTAITLKSGEAGVLYRPFGGGVDTEQTYGEGLHIIMPWNEMIEYNVRQQSKQERMSVLSINGLEVEVIATVWFEPVKKDLPLLHQEKGADYVEAILRPALNSAARSVVGRYTPEQLYSSKREAIQTEIFEETQKEVKEQYIKINKVLVQDVTLPTTIKSAIERKLRQEQEALEYEFRLEKARKEAERQKIDAEGKATANKILSASLTDKILKEKGIEATKELAKSNNSKVVVVGGKDGLPLILGNN